MINLRRPGRYLLSILSGILMVVGFPYMGNLTAVVFVAWVPLLLVESSITQNRYRSRKVFTHAFITFFIFNIGTTWWVWFASPVGAIMAFLANTLLMTFTFYLFHLTKKHVGSKEGYISLLIYWISFEYLHHNWDASWTWLTFGNYFSITPSWVQWYEYTGTMGGTFWVLIINLLIFRIYQNVLLKGESWRIQSPILYVAIAAFVIPLGTSLIMYGTYEEEKNPVEVVAIQPNIDPYNEKFSSSLEGQLDKIAKLMKSTATDKTELIVAPETAIGYPFVESEFKKTWVYDYMVDVKEASNDAAICIGASTFKHFDEKNSRASFPASQGGGFFENYNTSVFINEKNEPSYIHKSKLVPGTESIPFMEHLPFLEDLAIDLDGTSGTLGVEPHPKVFATKRFAFAPVVCYESIYGEWVSQQCNLGAELICISTNDGWWGDTPGYKQHLSFARLRAIENRRSVVRSANTGTSGFINQRGDVLQATEWWVEDAIRETLNLNKEQTFYMKYGNVMGRSFSFVTVLLILLTFVRRFKKRRTK